MTEEESQLQGLREISAQAAVVHDGAVIGVLMPGIRVQTSAGTEIMAAVLCPGGQGGYTTRLLLERRIPGKDGLNWQQVMAFGRNWHTWSWQNIPAAQPWINIYAEHARVLR
jgi:hypothetical protein